MGRRSRRRATEATRDHVAWVQTTDSVWLEFRGSLGVVPVSHALGDLVEAEVARQRRLRARAGEATDRELLDALDDARELHAQVEQLVRRLDARTAPQHSTSPRAEW